MDLKRLSSRLGLSPTTVSRALNGYTDVAESTRLRVVKMAQELGYQPNLGARRLALGRTDAVGIVYSLDAGDLGDPRFLEIIQGASDRLDAASLDLLIISAPQRNELRTYERLVRGGRVDGLIVSRTRVVDERIDYLKQAGVPFVAHGRTGNADGYAWFDFDNEAGTTLAVQQLVALGHRDIAYVHAPLTLNFAHERHEGFQRAMRAALLPIRPELVQGVEMNRRGGYAAGQRLLASKSRPTAILVDNNLCGVGVVRALLDANVGIGSEISVLVYDGVPADTLLRGQQIAAIEQPTSFEVGATLAQMVIDLIEGKPLHERQQLRQPRFVNGNSLGPAPGR